MQLSRASQPTRVSRRWPHRVGQEITRAKGNSARVALRRLTLMRHAEVNDIGGPAVPRRMEAALWSIEWCDVNGKRKRKVIEKPREKKEGGWHEAAKRAYRDTKARLDKGETPIFTTSNKTVAEIAGHIGRSAAARGHPSKRAGYGPYLISISCPPALPANGSARRRPHPSGVQLCGSGFGRSIDTFGTARAHIPPQSPETRSPRKLHFRGPRLVALSGFEPELWLRSRLRDYSRTVRRVQSIEKWTRLEHRGRFWMLTSACPVQACTAPHAGLTWALGGEGSGGMKD